MKKQASIIICAYNEESTISAVIETCRKYNPKDEIIAVDDGSTDKTPEILSKSFPITHRRAGNEKIRYYANS